MTRAQIGPGAKLTYGYSREIYRHVIFYVKLMNEQQANSEVDAPRRDQPAVRWDGRKTLFIASEVRSGSTFVAETLAYELHASLSYDLWQVAKEPFQDLDERSTPEEALKTLAWLHLDRSGFSGAKILCRQLAYLRRLASVSPALHSEMFGPRAYWIVVRRADRVGQAVSLAAARKNGIYHAYDGATKNQDADLSIELEEIGAAFSAIAHSDLFLELWTRELPPERTMSIVYEDFLVDQVGALQRIHDLCQFPPLDVAAYINESKLKPTEREEKRRATSAFKAYFLANYF